MPSRFGLLSLVLATFACGPSDDGGGPAACGDGEVQTGEACDEGARNGTIGPEAHCRADCGGTQQCGNGVKEGSETCDEGPLNGAISPSTQRCRPGCDGTQQCGNGTREGSEVCDDGADNGRVSTSQAYCDANCKGSQRCGNGEVEGTESCDDGAANGTISAERAWCLTGCNGTQRCGNGVREGSEACDEGLANGTVSTTATTCRRGCDGTQRCGNGATEGTEECDGGAGCGLECTITADADGDTIGDGAEGAPGADTDGDGTPDYLDLDSDADGIPDAVEAGDGMVSTPPVDSDADGAPDVRDLDSDGDGFPDAVEAGADPAHPVDTDGDGTPDVRDLDSDQDGLTDAEERAGGSSRIDPDSDDDTIIDVQDRLDDLDADGIVGALDLDSDGDGFSDALEAGDADPGTFPADTDGDGAPDFRDLDSERDGLPDAREVDCPGLGRHGRLFEDTDGDGYTDLAEVMVGSDPCSAASDVHTVGVDFYFVLPYLAAEQNDVLRFVPRVKQADVFFDIDTTYSMYEEMQNLKGGLNTIISTTRTRVSDAGFGVASFRDFPVSPFGMGADYPFALLSGITTDNTTITNAVNALSLGDGNDFPESDYEALYQVAHGGGVSGAAGSWGPFTTAGRIGGARFRPGAIPIVVHATDALMHDATCPATIGPYSGWTTDYPATYNDHSKAQALAALAAIGARVITVQSWYNDAALDSGIGAQTREISQQTGTAVPVCAFKTGAATWRCGANTCCSGTIASGPDCILRFTINTDGTGLTEAAVDGIAAILKYTKLNVFNRPRDDGSAGTPDTSLFLTRIVANTPDDTFKPPAEPERSCTPVPVPGAFRGAAFQNGFHGFAVGSSLATVEGAKLFFTVYAKNDHVPQTSEPQYFEAFIDIIDDTTNAVLDTQTVVVIVPARLQ